MMNRTEVPEHGRISMMMYSAAITLIMLMVLLKWKRERERITEKGKVYINVLVLYNYRMNINTDKTHGGRNSFHSIWYANSMWNIRQFHTDQRVLWLMLNHYIYRWPINKETHFWRPFWNILTFKNNLSSYWSSCRIFWGNNIYGFFFLYCYPHSPFCSASNSYDRWCV